MERARSADKRILNSSAPTAAIHDKRSARCADWLGRVQLDASSHPAPRPASCCVSSCTSLEQLAQMRERRVADVRRSPAMVGQLLRLDGDLLPIAVERRDPACVRRR